MNLDEMVKKSREAYHKYLKSEVEPQCILNEFKEYIENNFDLFEQAYWVDKKIRLSLKQILLQFDIEFTQKSEPFQNEFGKGANLVVPYGTIGVISGVNFYNVVRLINLAIYTKNSMIFNITEDYGSIYILIQGINHIFKKYALENFIQIYISTNGDVLEENERINAFVYIGKKVNATRLKISTGKPVIYSGCGNYEFYIDDLLDENLINQALDIKNMTIYSKKGIGIGKEVTGIEEVLSELEECGSEYSVGIMTESRENAQIFVDCVKARNLFVNALPTLIDEKLDIEPEDLVYKKSILMTE